MRAEDYLADPCGASSLPFWKTNQISIPPSLLIVRDDARAAAGARAADVPYFKMRHLLEETASCGLPPGFSLVSADMDRFAAHIAACYDELGISAEELFEYQSRSVYCAELWLAVCENASGSLVATGIGELDREIREGILEWIQVSPGYRRRGLGRFLVRELLFRLGDKADFVTVSGRLDDPANPFALYRSCGFQDPVIWHVLRK